MGEIGHNWRYDVETCAGQVDCARRHPPSALGDVCLCKKAWRHLRHAAWVVLQLRMRAVAKRGFAAVFAAAKKHLFIGLGGELYRRDSGVFVAAIAKGLFGRFSASAPKIGFSGLNLDWVGGFLGDDGGVCHGETFSLG
jgi:hypothetical protein